MLTIGESAFKQLYYQNPDFGFEVVRLLAGRLTQDVQDLERRLAQSSPPPQSTTPAMKGKP